MLALSVTFEVIISDTCFHPVRKQTQRSPSSSIPMSVNLASVTVNNVLPWGCTYEVGRCEIRESGPPYISRAPMSHPRAEPLRETPDLTADRLSALVAEST